MIISNNGGLITATDYWDSAPARTGLVHLSGNAGTMRLLLPDKLAHAVAEMRTAKSVVMARGVYQGRDAVELMFEDDSDSPYVLHIAKTQMDRTPTPGKAFQFTVYTRAGLQLGPLPSNYRVVASLPHMQAWK